MAQEAQGSNISNAEAIEYEFLFVLDGFDDTKLLSCSHIALRLTSSYPSAAVDHTTDYHLVRVVSKASRLASILECSVESAFRNNSIVSLPLQLLQNFAHILYRRDVFDGTNFQDERSSREWDLTWVRKTRAT